MKERYQATLLGCAIGDTLGVAVEGWKPEQIKQHVGRISNPIDAVLVTDEHGFIVQEDDFGKLGYYTKGLKRGEWTDDTMLTVAIAESLIDSQGYLLTDIAERHVATYEAWQAQNHENSHGFGRTTTAAIKRLQAGIPPTESGIIGGPGNAPAMKISPFGLYFHRKCLHKHAGLRYAAEIGRMTHLDPRSIASGVVQTYAIHDLLAGVDRHTFVEHVAAISSFVERPVTDEFVLADKGSLTERLVWVADHRHVSDQEAYETLGNSAVVMQSYPFAFFMFQKYWDSPLSGLINTINYGGDCDTTGAIYGALVGAKHGLIFPSAWTDVLVGYDRFMQLGEQVFTL